MLGLGKQTNKNIMKTQTEKTFSIENAKKAMNSLRLEYNNNFPEWIQSNHKELHDQIICEIEKVASKYSFVYDQITKKIDSESERIKPLLDEIDHSQDIDAVKIEVENIEFELKALLREKKSIIEEYDSRKNKLYSILGI